MTRLLALIFLLPLSLKAEYRVFKLRVINHKTKKSRTVSSTLDHLQYPEYYHIGPDEVVRMEDTWMCWKRHRAYDPLCERPVTEAKLRAELEEDEE